MGWIKLDDNFDNNRKFLPLERKRAYKISEKDLCELVYERVIRWCSRNASDGFITLGDVVDLDPTGGTAARALLRQGLIVPEKEESITSRSDVDHMSIMVHANANDRDRQAMLVVPDYLGYQRSRAQIEGERERDRLKKQRRRSAGQPPDGPPLSPGDIGGDTASAERLSPGGQRGGQTYAQDRVSPGESRGESPPYREEKKRTNSSRDDDLRSERADDHARAGARPSPSSDENEISWKWDGPVTGYKPDPYNPRCVDHAKIPLGVRGPSCGTCARVARWAAQELAKTRNGQSAAQLSRNGDDRRRRMAEIARGMLGDEALGLKPGEEFLGLRAIEGGKGNG